MIPRFEKTFETRSTTLIVAFGMVMASCGSPGVEAPKDNAGARGPSAGEVPEVSDGMLKVAPGCPATDAPRAIGRLGDDAVDEASGIVASRRHAGVFWVHNDSGDSARAFAVDRSGKLVTTLTWSQTSPNDVEDMAIEDVGDSSWLYFADIGDNRQRRSEVTIHRVAEPSLATDATSPLTVASSSETMRVRYVDGAHDAETLLLDPWTSELYVATKTILGPAAIHRVGPFVPGGQATTQIVARVPVPFATGGEISRDGRYIAIRNYTAEVSLWLRAEGETIGEALARTACKVPIALEKQGEAFAFLPDRSAYVTVSEGKKASLFETVFRQTGTSP